MLTALEGPNIIPAFDALYTNNGITWFTALPSGAESWVLGLPQVAATVLPQIISLQSLAYNAIYTTSSVSSLPSTIAVPTTTVPVTTTANIASATTTISSSSHEITKGQEIAAVVGSSVLFALVVAAGIILYDMRKKRTIARARRVANHPNRHRRTPLDFRMLYRKSRQDSSVTTSPDLGIDGMAQGVFANRGTQDEVYELHTPEIGHHEFAGS